VKEGYAEKRGSTSKHDWSTLYTCMKIEQWNPLKLFKKDGEGLWKCNRGGEIDENTLYACMEKLQWNFLFN
jgi:hypothetical protein